MTGSHNADREARSACLLFAGSGDGACMPFRFFLFCRLVCLCLGILHMK